ncbi:hypothetical protein [Sphingomonas albertensis]|uniref:Alpha/beta hydrolase n=1 Tax=Sphingomonas albertensis TaxID=2762591 RepID=A0ABR7AQ26_9SPHN|nr:hypothetical protein [Sphingomonas albertensis]MBC3942551.1 hypothetical protein [Sphingomonas albertensis]
MTGLRFDTYDWNGGREAMLRFGPDSGPIVIAALPLFDEANRTRQFACTILRALADHGIGSILPDFPGTGESVIATVGAKLSDQRRAYSELTQQLGARCYALSIRSGALLDTDADLTGRWHLAPQTGVGLVRDLERTRAAAGKSDRGDEYAGNRLSPEMLAELRDAVPCEDGRYRVVRLDTDPRAADATYAGAPLWRRSEPDNDIVLAQQLAADIAHWIASCED